MLRIARMPRALALAGIATIFLAGCSSTASSATPAQTPTAPAQTSAVASGSAPAGPSPTPNPAAACGSYSGPDTTISYATFGDATELTNQQKILDAFQSMEPKIKVKLSVSDWDTYWDKLQTALAGGNAPDVFVMDGPLFPDYQTRDQLLDLTPLIARDGFDTGQLADLGVKDFTASDGHLYGLPRDLSTIALYYNKTMFDAAGIPYPDGTWNWDKLVEVAKKLTTTSGGATQWGFYTETTDMENYWSSLVWQAGGDIVGPDKKTLLVDSDKAAAGIQFLQDLIYKSKVMAQPTPGGSGDLFENGQAAMEANGSWLVPTHVAAGIKFGVAPLPVRAGRTRHVGQPQRCRRLQGDQVHRRGLGVREVLHGPADADDRGQPQGFDARQQADPRQRLRDLVRRRRDLRRRADLRASQAVVPRLQRVQHGSSGRARLEGVQRQQPHRQGGPR